jgi:quercetin dioxygenase-like cupin family protein
MAKIVLDPGEVFAHVHPGPSTTTLLDGSATFAIGTDEPRSLTIGEAVSVPANTLHRLTNNGTGVATAYCGHTDPY